MPDPTLRLKYYQETGQADLAKQYEQYLRETGQMPSGDSEPQPGIGTKILGTIAATGRDIPGVEAVQAGLRSAVRTGLHKVLPESIAPDAESYREARDNIRGGEDAAPAALRVPARIAGGAIAAATIPGGPVLQGARYGILQGLAQSDQDVGIKQRIDDAAKGGAVGAITGGVASNIHRIPLGGVARAVMSPRKAAVSGIANVIRRAVGEARAPIATEAAEAVVPSADGFIGNGIDNLVDAGVNVGPRRLANRGAPLHLETEPIPAAAKDVLAQETPEVAEAVRHAPTRHRTGAQFDYFADQFAKRQAEQEAAAAASGVEPDIASLLAQTLKHVKQGGRLTDVVSLGPLSRIP